MSALPLLLTRRVPLTCSILFLLLLSPGDSPLFAQSSDPELAPATQEQADLLLTTAEEHSEDGQWLTAALAYESSANLRVPHDHRRAEGFSAAARMYHAGNFVQEAADMSVAAGQEAEEQGATALAAESFRNASLLNAELGKVRLASAYGLRACDIVESGSLRLTERRELKKRFGCS